MRLSSLKVELFYDVTAKCTAMAQSLSKLFIQHEIIIPRGPNFYFRFSGSAVRSSCWFFCERGVPVGLEMLPGYTGQPVRPSCPMELKGCIDKKGHMYTRIE